MTEIARRPAGALAVNPAQTDWTPDQRAALNALGIDTDVATEGDLRVFLTYAQKTGLDPFAKQLYLIGRDSWQPKGTRADGSTIWHKSTKFAIQTGIDGFRVIADRTGKYRGQTPPQWCGPDEQWHDVWLSDDPPAAARIGVLRADFAEPLVAVAKFNEYAPRNKDGKLTGQWPKMPTLMLAKVAEALALRKAFPNDLSGIYVAEEMDQAGPRPVTGNTPGRTLSELVDASLTAQTVDELRTIWREAAAAGLLDEDVIDEGTGAVVKLRDHLGDLVAALEASATVQGDDPAGDRGVVDVDLPAGDVISADAPATPQPNWAAAGGATDDPWATPAKPVQDAEA